MGTLSDFAESAVVKHITREAAYSPAATIYLALCTADPTDAATGASMNECANANGYTRKAVTFGAAASRRVTQSGTVTFDAATGSWGTATHYAIVDSATHGAGNVLASGAFTVAKSIVNGNTPSVASGETWVEITASTGLSNYAANGMLDRMFRNQAFTVSVNALGLSTATLSDSTSGTEVANSNNYSRLSINAQGGAQPSWAAESGGAATNANAWTMPTPSGSWGTVVASFIADSATYGAGNILIYDNGITDQAVAASDTVQYATSAFSFSQS